MTAATIRIDSGRRARVSGEVYGHFLEQAFFGNIEGGVFDEGSPLAVTGQGALDGCRADVIDAFRELGLPVVRWPGGNVASAYHWEDGIGPRDARPRRLELAWGSEETNRFGTPEFLAWIEAVSTERVHTRAYLAHSARDVDEAVRWAEHVNHAGDTAETRRRAADGHPEPYGVEWWGVGNEVYGDWQMGHRSAERYVEDALDHVRFLAQVDPSLRFVGVGWQQQPWTRTVVAGLGAHVDAISLHLYAVDHHLVAPTEAEFDAVVSQALFFERVITDQADDIAIAASDAHLDAPPAIAMDEWNCRHLEPSGWPEPLPGEDGGVAERGSLADDGSPRRVDRHSTRTLADALLYAGVFHAVHRQAGHPVPVAMANAVNLVNANGVLQVRPTGILRTPVFHVWDLYQNRLGRTSLATLVDGPSEGRAVRLGADGGDDPAVARTRHQAVGLLDASSALSDDGATLTVAVINRSASRDVEAALVLDGALSSLPPTATLTTLGADVQDLFQTNSLSAPDAVALREHGDVSLDDGRWTFPAHSVSLLAFRLR